jgi:glycosyltransferase involved in cell wall biosynthesis
MINILELIDCGFIGGGQMHILSICNNITKEKFKPIVCASPNGSFKDFVISSGYDFIDIKLPKLFMSKYLKKLDSIIKSNDIKILHAHGGVAGMYARFYKKKYNNNVKVIHTIHGIHYIHSRNLLRRKVSLYIEQYLSKYSDAYICVSNDDLKVGNEIRILEPSKTSVIYNGIDLTKFNPKKSDESLKESFGIKENDFVIGNVSRFDEQKNQILLVGIMPELIKHIPNVKLMLVGDGELRESVKRYSHKIGVTDRAIYTGSRSDVDKLYPLFDLFVFPSKWEGLSLTLIESLAAGMCIVASDIPANRELIDNETNGILFDLNDKKNLINQIIELYKNKDKAIKLSQNALNSSLKFDEKIMTSKIEQIYSKLINN